MKIHSILLLVFVRASSSSNNNIVDVWERSKELNKQEDWNSDIRKCKIKEVCPEHSKNCEDKVKWKKVGKKLFPFIAQETETKTLVDRRPTDFVQVK